MTLQPLHPDDSIIALGVKQPWAELILRGIKTVEVRSVGTNIRGTIYIYAAKKPANNAIAQAAIETHHLEMTSLPLGQIVGTVELVDVSPARDKHATAACIPATTLKDHYAWQLANPDHFVDPIQPKFLPYGIWFYPFRRKHSSS